MSEHEKEPDNEARRLAKEPFVELVRELVRTYQGFETLSGRHLRSLGLTPAQFDVIASLGNTQGMNLSTLAKKTLLTKSSLTGVVDRLERKGLVKRVVPPGDRRCFRIVLTPVGEDLFHDVFPRHLKYIKGLFGSLDQEQISEQVRSLRALRALFENVEES